MGGTDDPSNIIELTVEEHAQAHKTLYETYGKTEDLCAYYMLSSKNQDPEFVKLRASLGGTASYNRRIEKNIAHLPFFGANISNEEKQIICSNGGKVQGKINAEIGHIQRIQKFGASLGGKKSAEICRKEQKNAFFDPALRKEIVKLGGKVQGKINVESGHLKRIAKLSKRTKGKMWITDGIKNKMINSDDYIPEGFYKGKTQKTTR